MQHKIKTELSFIEPFIEAIPQFFVSVGVFLILVSNSEVTGGGEGNNIFLSEHVWNGNDTTITDVFGAKTLGIDNTIMFPLSILISALSGVKSIVDYISNGPMNITSNTKCGKVVLLSSMLMYVMSSFVGKFWILSLINVTRLVGPDGTMEEINGIWRFSIAFTILIAFPMIISIGPLVRVVAFRTCVNMVLNHPELLFLPVVTELVPGTISGGNHYNCCCRCCSCWTCCTWSCCCK